MFVIWYLENLLHKVNGDKMSNPNNQLLYLTAIDNDGNKQSLTLDQWAAHPDTTCINKNGQRIKITRDHIRNKYYAYRDHPERKLTMRHVRSEEHTSELQSPDHLVCRLLLEKKKKK